LVSSFGEEFPLSAMDSVAGNSEPKKFEPKKTVELNPPKSDPYTVAQLAECSGMAFIHSTVASCYR